MNNTAITTLGDVADRVDKLSKTALTRQSLFLISRLTDLMK